MFRHTRRICLTLFLLVAGCAPHVPVLPPTPVGPRQDWGRVTKTADCVVTGALPDPACTPGNTNAALTKDICGPDFHTSDYRDKESRPTFGPFPKRIREASSFI